MGYIREIVSLYRTDLDPFHGQKYFLNRWGLNFCKSLDQKFVNSFSFNFFSKYGIIGNVPLESVAGTGITIENVALSLHH